jgi:hypothetical protein
MHRRVYLLAANFFEAIRLSRELFSFSGAQISANFSQVFETNMTNYVT